MVSQNIGHLDFGGGGYLKLAGRLKDQGHNLHWIARDNTAAVLRKEKHAVSSHQSVNTITSPRHMSRTQVDHVVDQLIALREELRRDLPDLCLVDRNLGCATLVLNALGIPFACIGTPGGYWSRDEHGVISIDSPDEHYLELGKRLHERASWLAGDLESFWQPSPFANVVFTGHSFYPGTKIEFESAFVNLFAPDRSPQQGKIGISLGNTGDVRKMVRLLHLLATHTTGTRTTVFTGNRSCQLEHLRGEFPEFEVQGWCNFHQAFSQLKAIVCFGGIGTLWHGINHLIPILVLPGGAGDQRYNGDRIQELELGLTAGLEPGDDQILACVDNLLLPGDRPAFDTFLSKSNFTDSLDSIVEKLLQLK